METADDCQHYWIDPERLWHGESVPDAPFLLLDLDAAPPPKDQPVLPPCPLIGIGDPASPWAGLVDAVVEPGFAAASLARRIAAQPQAAAVTVQLLRLLPGMPPEEGLTTESLAYAVLQGSAGHRAWMAERAQEEAAEGRVSIERTEDALVLTLDRPDAGNAIDRAMRDALYDGLMAAALDPDLSRVVLQGRGRSFSLGADLGEFGTMTDPATAHAIRARTLPSRAAMLCADRLEARVQGACVGAGLELASWAKRIVAAPDAWFQLPELAMGILPGAGGCVSLTRRIGRQRTALLILSGKRIGARLALDWGLVDEIAADPDGAGIG